MKQLTSIICLFCIGLTTEVLAQETIQADPAPPMEQTKAVESEPMQEAGPETTPVQSPAQTPAAESEPEQETASETTAAQPDTPAADTSGEESGEGFQALDQQIQDLKREVIKLNRDLFILEEELLFPANSQVAIFLSVDIGEFFRLDSMQLKIDGQTVTSYLYTDRESEALIRGGVQRLYVGNLRIGTHELVGVFTGKGPENRDYKRGTTLTFEKETDPKFLELKIADTEANYQPEFQVKEW